MRVVCRLQMEAEVEEDAHLWILLEVGEAEAEGHLWKVEREAAVEEEAPHHLWEASVEGEAAVRHLLQGVEEEVEEVLMLAA